MNNHRLKTTLLASLVLLGASLALAPSAHAVEITVCLPSCQSYCIDDLGKCKTDDPSPPSINDPSLPSIG